MVTLHILELLKDNGYGVDLNSDLHWEKLPLKKDGVAIFSRGGEQNYGRSRCVQRFDLYSRHSNSLVAYDKLDKIRLFLAESYGETCDLPTVPNKSNRVYNNVRFTVIDNIENIGVDGTDKVVFRLAAQIIYEREE
jgi:hypothetical protein